MRSLSNETSGLVLEGCASFAAGVALGVADAVGRGTCDGFTAVGLDPPHADRTMLSAAIVMRASGLRISPPVP